MNHKENSGGLWRFQRRRLVFILAVVVVSLCVVIGVAWGLGYLQTEEVVSIMFIDCKSDTLRRDQVDHTYDGFSDGELERLTLEGDPGWSEPLNRIHNFFEVSHSVCHRAPECTPSGPRSDGV